MNVGIVGYGAWGGIHAASVAGLAESRLTAIACTSEESASRAREEYPEITVYTDYRKLLETEPVDTVHVVVPSYLHAEVALAALKAGKNVLLEKPMATTVADCEEIVEAAEGSEASGGPLLSLVHELRCSEQWGSIRNAVESGDIGRPHYAMLNLFRFPYRGGSGQWRYDANKVGSWVLEEPIHFFDLLLWYFEGSARPVAVSSFHNEYGAGLTRDFTAIVEFDTGGYAIVSQTLSGFEHHQVVEVTGTSGSVRSIWSGAMDRTDKPEFSVTIQKTGSDNPERLRLDSPSGELFEIRDYINQAHRGFESRTVLYSARKELDLIRLCLAAEESARTGKRVELTNP